MAWMFSTLLLLLYGFAVGMGALTVLCVVIYLLHGDAEPIMINGELKFDSWKKYTQLSFVFFAILALSYVALNSFLTPP